MYYDIQYTSDGTIILYFSVQTLNINISLSKLIKFYYVFKGILQRYMYLAICDKSDNFLWNLPKVNPLNSTYI